VIPAEEKTANIKIFKKEGAFYQYLDRFMSRSGYVLLITSPLKKDDQDVVRVSSSPVKRKD